MLLERDAALEARDERSRRGQLDLRLLQRRLGGQAAFEPQPRLPHPLLAGLERTAHDAQLLIERHEFVVGGRHLGHERHLQRPLRLDRCQVLGHGAPVGPAQIAPQIQLPGQRNLDIEFGVVLRRRTAVVVVFGVGGQLSRQRGQLSGLRHASQRTHATHIGRRRQHVPVAFERAADQRRECRIGIDAPPRPVGQRQRVGRPRHDSGRQLRLGTHDPAASQHTGGAEQDDARQQRSAKDISSFHDALV